MKFSSIALTCIVTSVATVQGFSVLPKASIGQRWTIEANALRATADGEDCVSLQTFLEAPNLPESLYVAAAASKDDEPDTIFDLLKDGNDKVPGATSVAVVDKTTDISSQMLRSLKDIQLLTSFINAYAAQRVYDARDGKPYNLDNPAEALQFTVDYANNLNLVLTKSMAGFLTLGKVSTQTFNQETTTVELHTDILKLMFDSLSLPEKALTELDGILEAVNNKLTVSIDKASQDVKHVLFYYYFEPVPGLEEVKVAKLRFFFLSIDKSSWDAQVAKQKVKRFKFSMLRVDTECEMNQELVEQKRDAIVALVEKITSKNIDDVNKAISPKVVSKE